MTRSIDDQHSINKQGAYWTMLSTPPQPDHKEPEPTQPFTRHSTDVQEFGYSDVLDPCMINGIKPINKALIFPFTREAMTSTPTDKDCESHSVEAPTPTNTTTHSTPI
jgi:hypothetical protein